MSKVIEIRNYKSCWFNCDWIGKWKISLAPLRLKRAINKCTSVRMPYNSWPKEKEWSKGCMGIFRIKKFLPNRPLFAKCLLWLWNCIAISFIVHIRRHHRPHHHPKLYFCRLQSNSFSTRSIPCLIPELFWRCLGKRKLSLLPWGGRILFWLHS